MCRQAWGSLCGQPPKVAQPLSCLQFTYTTRQGPVSCLSRDETWALAISLEHSQCLPRPPQPPPPLPTQAHAFILSPPPSKSSLCPRPFPCEAHSFHSLHGPIRKAHWPGQGTQGTHQAPAPAGYHSHPNNDMTKSLLRLNSIRLWENTRERLLWKYLFKPKNVKTTQTKKN